MRVRNRLFIAFLFLVVLALALYFFFRPEEGQAAYGPAAALCPGPDEFGYTCATADGFAYLDATQDTGLYQDDGIVEVELPFAFNFYGTPYTSLWASSNGFVRFDSGATPYANECLINGPMAGLGDVIAPYWDDLDLTEYGYLETAVFGSAPARIFVVEWDNVPRYGDPDGNEVSFAIHLFEGSNDIVFLYEDVTTLAESNGRSATIGLQSEAAGVSLQYSCNQAAVSDASGRYFPYPTTPNPDTTHQPQPGAFLLPGGAAPATKGEVVTLLTTLNSQGLAALGQLQRHWLSQTPQRRSEWARVDLDGNGRSELILLWRGPAQFPELSQLVVLTADENGQMSLWLDHRFATRTGATPQYSLGKTTDLTGDDLPDLLLTGQDDNAHLVLTAVAGELRLLPLSQISSCQLGAKTVLCTP